MAFARPCTMSIRVWQPKVGFQAAMPLLSVKNPEETMPHAIPFALIALVSLAVASAPIERAFGQKPAAPVTVTNTEVPVTVNNPTTSPVPTMLVNPATIPALTSSVDDPGRNAYQGFVSASCGTSGECEVTFPNVPQGHRLVVQHVSAQLFLSNLPIASVEVALNKKSSSNPLYPPAVTFFAPPPQVVNASAQIQFDQPVLFYFDGGDIPDVTAFVTGTSNNLNAYITGGNVLLTGRLVDCTLTLNPCAPITH
jgi:hypothetical protein